MSKKAIKLLEAMDRLIPALSAGPVGDESGSMRPNAASVALTITQKKPVISLRQKDFETLALFADKRRQIGDRRFFVPGEYKGVTLRCIR